jgi:Leucine-rich repeat (LRR) protein
MRNSYGLKRKGVDLSQGPPKRKRDVEILAVIETPLVPTENAPSSSGWRSNVVLLLNLMMSFLCIVFSSAFPSYMLKFDFSLLFFILFGCVLTIFLDPYNHDSLLSPQSIRRRRSSSDLNCQPAASQPYPLATRYLNVLNHLQASLSYIFSLPTFQFVCLDQNNMK